MIDFKNDPNAVMKRALELQQGLKCERCGTCSGVELESSRTMYHWDKDEKEDPNAPCPLCRRCAADHHEYWDSMWNDYYGGLMH